MHPSGLWSPQPFVFSISVCYKVLHNGWVPIKALAILLEARRLACLLHCTKPASIPLASGMPFLTASAPFLSLTQDFENSSQ